MLESITGLGTVLSKKELSTIKGKSGITVGCASGIEYNIRGYSDKTASELCSGHGGVAYIVLLEGN